jgi:LPXTG-site transpeptidase (sortase) family protein
MFHQKFIQHGVITITLICGLMLSAQAAENPEVIIPDLKIARHITEFPLGDPTWIIDPWETGLGHLEGTAAFGSSGNVILAAHAEYPDGSDGLFAQLDQLRPGTPIIVVYAGEILHYRVVKTRLVPPDDLSLIYPSLDSRITFITCDVASYNPQEHTYGKRVVVTAIPAR